MTGLTAAALAIVGFLAYQASAAHERAEQKTEQPTASASAQPGADADADEKTAGPEALPPGSGTGRRVVYALGADRVWLVAEDGSVRRTYTVKPGTLDPVPGAYTVTSRDNAVTGTDGVPVEHVVRFATFGGTGIGFSAPREDDAEPVTSPTPGQETGGIREERADGRAMWVFAEIGTPVVVVP
ncbi:L,D-transpeptidase [Streptomyces sp. JJ66]|uniref:L,D-transpeptidase n=1 Tax=Streptomyces sp. JJ66 TaxID=2803843 RepID=UPI0035B4611A